jgi:uncharacterized protein YceK
LVERQLPKLNVASSNLVSRSKYKLLQLGLDEWVLVGSCSSVVEHSLGKGEVDGSIPSTSSNKNSQWSSQTRWSKGGLADFGCNAVARQPKER